MDLCASAGCFLAVVIIAGEFVLWKNKDEKKASLIKPFVA